MRKDDHAGGPDLLAGLVPSDERFAVDAADRLLKELVRQDGSDLHLWPTPEGVRVLVRTAGTLRPVTLIVEGGPRVVTRLKVMAGLLTYQSDRPQEGRLAAGAVPGLSLDARLATCPTVNGEKAAVRRFADAGDFQTLDQLGLSPAVAARWRAALSATGGLLLATGPAGSGKTTTAYASLREVIARSPTPRSMVSLEDPVEQVIEGVTQTAVGGHTPMTFADGLRAALRHDPEVIFVGELRDRDTISTALTAALTGHLVISTLHTGEAAEAVTRLLDVGVEPFLILSGLRAVLHQRLVRTLDGGRTVVGELLSLDDRAAREAVRRRRPQDLSPVAPIRPQVDAMKEAARIDAAEIVRLFGLPVGDETNG